jgi:hypothetical protein
MFGHPHPAALAHCVSDAVQQREWAGVPVVRQGSTATTPDHPSGGGPSFVDALVRLLRQLGTAAPSVVSSSEVPEPCPGRLISLSRPTTGSRRHC